MRQQSEAAQQLLQDLASELGATRQVETDAQKTMEAARATTEKLPELDTAYAEHMASATSATIVCELR